MKVVLVGCGSTKRAEASPARELYTSLLFRKSLSYALRIATTAQHVYIVSAKYGLLELDQVVEPYNFRLTSMPLQRRITWGVDVALDLAQRRSGADLVLLMGATYVDPLALGLRSISPPFASLTVPMHGMGIGVRLGWLHEQIAIAAGTLPATTEGGLR